MGTTHPPPVLGFGGSDGGGDLEEGVSLERGPADQPAVDAVLGGKVPGVPGVHTAAVEQRDVARRR